MSTLLHGAFGIIDKRTFSFDLGSYVRSAERDERRRLTSTVALAICSPEAQELIMEVVRIKVAEELAEQISRYRRLLRRRTMFQVFATLSIVGCVAGFYYLIQDHHSWVARP